MLERQQSQELLCQSCGVPLVRREDFGTCANGGRINDYCRRCYRDGDFVEPNLTKQEMMARITGQLMGRRGVSEEDARAVAHRVVSTLRRWMTTRGT